MALLTTYPLHLTRLRTCTTNNTDITLVSAVVSDAMGVELFFLFSTDCVREWRSWALLRGTVELPQSPLRFGGISLVSRTNSKKLNFFSGRWPVGHSEWKSGWCVLDTRGRSY
jgi:hypothetical protein